MSCSKPLLAIKLGVVDGKNRIKIFPFRPDFNIRTLEERYGHDNLLLLPCGKCAGCKMAHQRDWAVRCELESMYHKESCMVTLTYSEKQCPKKLVKRDLQQFIKDLRNKGLHFRYFACGEYGSSNGRPHYHIILFGYWPRDAKVEFNSKSGFPIYSSNFISDIWNRGIISVSEMSPGTAAYVAGYVDKKLGNDEFLLMSKRPGIGEHYFRDNLLNMYAYDNLVGKFGISKIPRYGDKIADQMFYDISDIKEKRIKASNLNLLNEMQVHSMKNKEEVFIEKGRVQKDKLDRRRRL